MSKSRLYETVDANRERLEDLADAIWETPELGLHEEQSSRVLREALAEDGFEIETGVGGMPTAFVAEYGGGDPTVGLLGEFDALPGLSQEVAAERAPIEEGGPGHGCGHNLFGTACAGAAVAVKDAIESGELDGTIRFYGCPAEETLVGKVFMARAGVFDDLDAALTWHPGDVTTPTVSSSLALDSVRFRFEGESAHAAAAPESGRSALDAVQLLNTGAEYVREHVPDDARIHYNVVEGGDAPNVVPASAEVWYYVRAPTREGVDAISDWLGDVAEGAALMTQTSVERRYLTGCHSYLPNGPLAELIWEQMVELDPIDYDDGDSAFAAELTETLDPENTRQQHDDVPEGAREELLSSSLYPDPIEAYGADEPGKGSTDVGDVSWIAPTGQFRAATWAVGTPAHSWQAVAANGSFGTKGVPYAAKVLAGTAYDLVSDADALAAAQAAFDEARDGREYETPLPADAEPPFDVTAD